MHTILTGAEVGLDHRNVLEVVLQNLGPEHWCRSNARWKPAVPTSALRATPENHVQYV